MPTMSSFGAMKTALAVIGAAVLLGVGVCAGWNLKPTPDPVYQRVEVPVGPMLKLEPKFELEWLEKILTTQLRPQQRAVATGGAKTEVAAFCEPAVAAAVNGDTVPTRPTRGVDPVAVLGSHRLSDPWNPWASRQLDLFGWTNLGDRFHDIYEVPASGEIEAGVVGDSTAVNAPRAGWMQPTVTHGVAVGVGVLIGFVLAVTQ